MLLPEQYMMIYLLSTFMCSNRDARIISCYALSSFLLDFVLYSVFMLPIYDFIILSYAGDFIIFIFISQFISNIYVRNGMFLLYILGMVNPLLVTTLPYFLLRDDMVSTVVYMISIYSVYIINEIVIAIMLNINNKITPIVVYWRGFIFINYLIVILLQI